MEQHGFILVKLKKNLEFSFHVVNSFICKEDEMQKKIYFFVFFKKPNDFGFSLVVSF